MKLKKLLLSLSSIMLLISCYKPGKIRVQNNISQVKITEVNWRENNLSWELLPGETSDIIEISKSSENLPVDYNVSFKMEAIGKTVYLETSETFLLNEDEEILINLNDSTEIFNPSQP